MSSNEPYDVVVVGAGIEGSSAAYQCVKAGKRVLLLEQYSLPHTRGSSHGGHRCTMFATSRPYQRPMMKESYALWEELEKETNVEIKKEVGTLVVVTPEDIDKGYSGGVMEAMEESSVPLEKVEPEDRRVRFPGFTPPSNLDSYLYWRAGYLLANKALSCFQSEFVKRGGVLRDGEKMVEIVPGAMATVKTNQGEYQAKSLIITPGPWAAKVLQPLGLDLPLQVKRVHHMFWKEKVEGSYREFPAYFHIHPAGFEASAIPSVEYPGLMKVSVWAPEAIPDPDFRDSGADSTPREIELSRDYVRDNFPGLEADDGPAIKETCMTTETPDFDFIIDVHPEHPNIAFGVGFSGDGFEFAPIVGKILCQLALGEKPEHDITPMGLKRFAKTE